MTKPKKPKLWEGSVHVPLLDVPPEQPSLSERLEQLRAQQAVTAALRQREHEQAVTERFREGR